MSTIQHITTAKELIAAHGLDRCELIRGELVMMTPAGFEHGRIVARVCGRLQQFVEAAELGVVTGAETGFQIGHDPDTVRAPDAAFVQARRIPSPLPHGFFQGPPDLAVEVLSPSDRAGEVLTKVQNWLDSGCRAVWLIDPANRKVSVYHAHEQTVTWSVANSLDGGDVLPGFQLSVAELFAS